MGGSFLSGLVSGGVDEYTKKKKKTPKPKSTGVTGGSSVGGTQSNPYFSESDGGGSSSSDIQSFKRGGKVKGKKGKPVMIKAHAGERVLTAKQQKKMGMKMDKKRMGRKHSGGKRR